MHGVNSVPVYFSPSNKDGFALGKTGGMVQYILFAFHLICPGLSRVPSSKCDACNIHVTGTLYAYLM